MPDLGGVVSACDVAAGAPPEAPPEAPPKPASPSKLVPRACKGGGASGASFHAFNTPFGYIGAPPSAASADGKGTAAAAAAASAASALLVGVTEYITEPMLALTVPKLGTGSIGLKIGGMPGTNSETAAVARASEELDSFALSAMLPDASVSQSMLIYIYGGSPTDHDGSPAWIAKDKKRLLEAWVGM